MHAFRKGALAAVAIAGLSAQLASAAAPNVGNTFFTIKVTDPADSTAYALGSAHWGGTQSLSPTVYFDNNTSTYHMWFMANGTPTPDTTSEAASLFEGDLTTYRHATSSDGINYTASPGNLTFLGGTPNYAARGATTTPSMMFPRVSQISDGSLRLVTWTHNQGFPNAGVVFGEYSYNESVNTLSLATPTVVTHLGPLNPPPAPAPLDPDQTPASAFPGQSSSPMGFITRNGVDYLVVERDLAFPNTAPWIGVYDDQLTNATYTQPSTTGEITGATTDEFFQISRALDFLNETIGSFTQTAGWMAAGDRSQNIRYMESTDGGLTWTNEVNLISGPVTIDGLAPGGGFFDAPEVALSNGGFDMLFMFTARDNAGNLVVVGNVVDAPNIPEPASLALLAAGGLMLLRRRRA